MEPFVVVVTLPGTEERFTRTCRGPVVVGRSEECDIQLPHPLVSRQHARLSCVDGGAIAVRDLGSSNGTVVQDSALRDGERTIAGEATVHIGPYMLRISTELSTESETLVDAPAEHAGRLALNRDRRTATVDGRLAVERLSPQEFQLLDLLDAAAPRTLSSAELGDAVWGADAWDRYMLHNLVRRVRRKLEAGDAPASELLVTVPGAGYRLG